MRRTFQRNLGKEESNRQKLLIGVGIFIVAIMIFSIFGVSSFSNDPVTQSLQDSGLTFRPVFVDDVELWETTISGEKKQFTTLPSQLSDIETDISAPSLIEGAYAVTLTIPVSNETTYAYRYDLSRLRDDMPKDKYVIYASTSQINPFGLVQAECANATTLTPVVELRFANESRIVRENNCVYLDAPNDFSMIHVIDRFRYLLLGVTVEQ